MKVIGVKIYSDFKNDLEVKIGFGVKIAFGVKINIGNKIGLELSWESKSTLRS